MIAETLITARLLTPLLAQPMPLGKLIVGLITCLEFQAARLLLEGER